MTSGEKAEEDSGRESWGGEASGEAVLLNGQRDGCKLAQDGALLAELARTALQAGAHEGPAGKGGGWQL